MQGVWSDKYTHTAQASFDAATSSMRVSLSLDCRGPLANREPEHMFATPHASARSPTTARSPTVVGTRSLVLCMQTARTPHRPAPPLTTRTASHSLPPAQHVCTRSSFWPVPGLTLEIEHKVRCMLKHPSQPHCADHCWDSFGKRVQGSLFSNRRWLGASCKHLRRS